MKKPNVKRITRIGIVVAVVTLIIVVATKFLMGRSQSQGAYPEEVIDLSTQENAEQLAKEGVAEGVQGLTVPVDDTWKEALKDCVGVDAEVLESRIPAKFPLTFKDWPDLRWSVAHFPTPDGKIRRAIYRHKESSEAGELVLFEEDQEGIPWPLKIEGSNTGEPTLPMLEKYFSRDDLSYLEVALEGQVTPEHSYFLKIVDGQIREIEVQGPTNGINCDREGETDPWDCQCQ